jgi:glycosyltransferase involved in cell wall biosynthesis
MKVLHVIPSVGPLRGGPSVMLRTMSCGLAQAGVAVDIATTDDNGAGRLDVSHAKPVVEDGVTYWYFPRQTKFYTFSWPLTCWLAQHVKDYDVVHVHALFSYAAIPAALYAKRYNVPYIVRPLGVLNRWGVENRRRYLKKLSFTLIEKHILNNAAAIHYTSEQERLEAAELGVKDRAVIIANAVDVPLDIGITRGRFRSLLPQLGDSRMILFLSRIDRKKGLDILLAAFAKIHKQEPRVMLVIAGNGEAAFIGHLRQQATRLGIGSEIIWPGFLSGDDKRAALADADIFILPSYSENFGVSVVEAMAAGVPVIVSDQVAIHQEIAAGRAGIVVPCAVADLAAALDRFIVDEKLRSTMGKNGRLLARTKYSVEAVRDDLLTLYRDVSSRPAPTVRQPAQQFN